MAMVSPMVTAEIVQAEDHPDLARRYSVSGVPKTVINDRVEFVGAAPEGFVLEKIMSFNQP